MSLDMMPPSTGVSPDASQSRTPAGNKQAKAIMLAAIVVLAPVDCQQRISMSSFGS
jgi:hypothetical protein